MFSIDEYPPSFYNKVFDLFVEYFNVDESKRENFVAEYSVSPYVDSEAFEITYLPLNEEKIILYFYVPDDEYPHLAYSHRVIQEYKYIVSFNEKIKQLADHCMKFKAFL